MLALSGLTTKVFPSVSAGVGAIGTEAQPDGRKPTTTANPSPTILRRLLMRPSRFDPVPDRIARFPLTASRALLTAVAARRRVTVWKGDPAWRHRTSSPTWSSTRTATR